MHLYKYHIHMFIFYHILLFLSSHPNSIIAITLSSSSIATHKTQSSSSTTTTTIKPNGHHENCQHHLKFSTRSRHTLTHTLTTHTHTCTHNKPYIIASSKCCSCNLCFILFINHFEYIFSRFWFCFRFLNLF